MLDDKIKLYENERILFIARPSWKFYTFKFFTFFSLMLGTSFFYFFLIGQDFYGILIIICLVLLSLIYGLQGIVIYYYNVYILTNLRIIGIEQTGLFTRTIMSIKINYVNDINFLKGKRLYIKLLDESHLIIDNIEDKEYFYETVKNLVELRKTGNRKIDFIKRKI
ncbi:MAG: hypothetical protein V1860_02025 [bacterium]